MDEFASRQHPLKEHMRFQQRMWVVERIGWGILAAIALVALTGLFGIGWLSTQTITSGSASVEYERFQRITRLTHLTFHVATGGQNELRLRLGPSFRDNYEFTSIQPPPIRTEAQEDGLVLTFAVPAANGAVKLWAHPRRAGSQQNEIQIAQEPPLTFWTFVYP